MFVAPPPPSNEAERLEFLVSCGILDTPKDERFDRITRLSAQFYEADAAFIGFVDDRYQWMKSLHGDDIAPWVRRDHTICQMVIASGEPLVIGDLQSDPRLQGHPLVADLPFRFYAGVPLLTDDRLAVASLCVLKRTPQPTEGFELSPLRDLGAIAMDELELWRRNRELARLADTDSLTGLANRRAFDAALDHAWRRLQRTGTPLSLLLVDLDRFKILNDQWGHQAGDDVLRRFAPILSEAVDGPGIVAARYGGEEFGVILPDTDSSGASDKARQIRALLAAARIPHPHGIHAAVTASIGIATLRPGSAATVEMFIAQADAALYRAKQLGRDRAIAYAAD